MVLGCLRALPEHLCVSKLVNHSLGFHQTLPGRAFPGGGGECGLNRVYLAAGCVCVGRTPRASCQIDPIWCSSVSGPRELNNLNPGASPYLNYLIGAGN